MAVYARIEVEEQRLEIVRARHREIALVFNHDLKTIEISNLSISLQVAYLGVAVTCMYTDFIHGMDKLLLSFRDLSIGSKDVLQLMRRAANGFQVSRVDEQFVWGKNQKEIVQNLLVSLHACLKQAKSIYNDLETVCPHPQAEIKKIYNKISKITAKINSCSYISVENYKNHIRVSCALLKVSKLQHAMISVAALGCFITGIEHIIETINSFVSIFDSHFDCTVGNDLMNIHSMVTLVVIATASAVYFDSISFAVNEIIIFVGDKYTCEKSVEVFRHLSRLFLKSMKKQNTNKTPGYRGRCGVNENEMVLNAIEDRQFNVEFFDDGDDSTDDEEEVVERKIENGDDMLVMKSESNAGHWTVERKIEIEVVETLKSEVDTKDWSAERKSVEDKPFVDISEIFDEDEVVETKRDDVKAVEIGEKEENESIEERKSED